MKVQVSGLRCQVSGYRELAMTANSTLRELSSGALKPET